MELNVLVVEDSSYYRNKFVKYLSSLPFVSKVLEAKDSDEMFSIVSSEKNHINALLLDVDLGEESLNGMDAYALIKDQGVDIPAILVTGNSVEACHSYTIGIVDVVSKSMLMDFSRLRSAIEKMYNYFEYKTFIENGKICVPICGELNATVYPSEIKFIESVNRDVMLFLANGKSFHSTLGVTFYHDLLEEYGFVRSHRSYLVNQKYIESFNNEELGLGNNVVIPISKDRLLYVKQALTPSRKGLFGLKLFGSVEQCLKY